MKQVANDTYGRTLVKAVTFRIFILITDGLIIFAVTHDYGTTSKFLVITTVIRTIIYLIHERAWNLITWGKIFRTVT